MAGSLMARLVRKPLSRLLGGGWLTGESIFIYLLSTELKLIEPVPWAYNKVYFEYNRCFGVIII